jgi:hypothetical protein
MKISLWKQQLKRHQVKHNCAQDWVKLAQECAVTTNTFKFDSGLLSLLMCVNNILTNQLHELAGHLLSLVRANIHTSQATTAICIKDTKLSVPELCPK